MIALIEDNRDAIVALCERYGVRRLSLFGSAAKGTLDGAFGIRIQTRYATFTVTGSCMKAL